MLSYAIGYHFLLKTYKRSSYHYGDKTAAILQNYACLYKLKENKKMKSTKNKLALALLAIFAISIVTSIPLINIEAQAATTQKTYAISDAIPSTIGLGEANTAQMRYHRSISNSSLWLDWYHDYRH